jgi:spermidine/putrescine-binding protein
MSRLRRIIPSPGRLSLAALLCAATLACQPAPDDGRKPTPKASHPTLSYFTWTDYVGPDLLEAFERRTGAQVIVDTFSSNEELLAKLQSGAVGYDVAVPSDFMVSIMMQQGLLAELDLAPIPNARDLVAALDTLPVDPEHRYAVPYLWGTVGIGYDSSVITTPPDSWTVLWEDRYRGRISMLNDQREVFGAVLRSMGHSVNTRDPAIIE